MTERSKTIFVTGGSGFVGKALLKRLTAKGWTVLAMARSESAAKIVADLGAEPVIASLEDLDTCTEALSRSGAVVHLAARKSGSKVADYWRDNHDTAVDLAQRSCASGVSRFVFVSTGSLAARAGEPACCVKEDEPVGDQAWLPYLDTKKNAERSIQSCDIHGQFRTVSLRPCLIWAQDAPFADNVTSGSWRAINGGDHLHSTIHVDNLAQAIELVLKADDAQLAPVFHVNDYPTGDPKTLRLAEVVEALRKSRGLSGVGSTVSYGLAKAGAGVTDFFFRLFNPGSVLGARAAVQMFGQELTTDDSLIRERLGYEAEHDAREILARLSEAS
ncbi:MAG: NAD-dependent epimerase/dehydratase family protein [Alphaproteobacteria bacterium]